MDNTENTKEIFTSDDNFRPGRSSVSGFLNEIESLDDVIQTDNKALVQMGLTHAQFADRLETLIQKARHKISLWRRGENGSVWEFIEKGIIVEDMYNITFDSYMGYQGCPFACQGREALSDTDYTITNIQSKESVFFSELHVHLIRCHQFFEGHTHYRLDPTKCAMVLGIERDKDFSPKYRSREYWVVGSGHSYSSKTIEDYRKHEFIDTAKDVMKSGQRIHLNGHKSGWMKDDNLYIISLDEMEYEQTVNGITVYRIEHGAYTYQRKIIRWVEDQGD